ncbi:MAG TPA: hypothetical protein VE954_31875 [Oligoflexus sp.]|uniref:hypothetical protein n=1 Tax=Oligoflexus sp. TaxID=1971216 RepID=UPI002D6B069E|nr:hypothetical protein [Oligoflexus sp.]HYX37724.1 hypothetical protein [Oligoflexus sp.]
MEIKVSELRSIANKLFDHLEHRGHSSLTIESDFYWSIPQEQLYDTYADPKNFTQGQLSDDWSELQSILKGEKEPLGFALVWLASVLRKIGEDTVV